MASLLVGICVLAAHRLAFLKKNNMVDEAIEQVSFCGILTSMAANKFMPTSTYAKQFDMRALLNETIPSGALLPAQLTYDGWTRDCQSSSNISRVVANRLSNKLNDESCQSVEGSTPRYAIPLIVDLLTCHDSMTRVQRPPNWDS